MIKPGVDYNQLKSDNEIAALGEKDAARILDLKLHSDLPGADHHAHGIDAVDADGKTYEIKARAVRTIKIKPWLNEGKRLERKNPFNLSLYKIQPVDGPYDFLVVLKYDEFGKLLQVAKLARKDVKPNIKETKGVKYVRLSIINDSKAQQISIA